MYTSLLVLELTATPQSATATLDYGAFTPADGQVEFAAGEDTKMVTLPIVNDMSEEHTEQLIVKVEFVDPTTAATAGQVLLEPLHKAIVVINDDDNPGKLQGNSSKVANCSQIQARGLHISYESIIISLSRLISEL